MKKLDIDGAVEDIMAKCLNDNGAMPKSVKVGYVVFHSGNAKGTVPFYLTKSRMAFSSNFEVAEIFGNPEEAREAMMKLFNKIGDEIACKKFLGVGRITFDVVDNAVRQDRSEVKGTWNNKELAAVFGNDNGKVDILYLDGFYKRCSDVFAVPQNKTVRIRCGKGSRTFYEIDCESGNFIEWIEHMEEKGWYNGELKEVANEYIRHFCEKWGC